MTLKTDRHEGIKQSFLLDGLVLRSRTLHIVHIHLQSRIQGSISIHKHLAPLLRTGIYTIDHLHVKHNQHDSKTRSPIILRIEQFLAFYFIFIAFQKMRMAVEEFDDQFRGQQLL